MVETHFFFSSDPTQDAAFVNLAYKRVLQNLSDRYPGLRNQVRVWFRWSDNCAAQFKCADSFALTSQWYEASGIFVQQDFTEASHGKGLHDSEGGIVKRAINDELRRTGGVLFKTVEEIVEFAMTHLTVPASQELLSGEGDGVRIKARVFYNLTPDELQVERSNVVQGARPVPQTLKIHSVRSGVSTGHVAVRMLSCYCRFCRFDAAGISGAGQQDCSGREQTGAWETHVLHAADAAEQQQQQQAAAAPVLAEGEVVALIYADADAPLSYRLMLVKACEEIEDQDWRDRHGKVFRVESHVIKGRWFQAVEGASDLHFQVNKVGALSGARPEDLFCRGIPTKAATGAAKSKGATHSITRVVADTIQQQFDVRFAGVAAGVTAG
ncbi:hypothetical protein PLESTF_000864100 [Pleodorina starrii]|nr:hypothetical protein PLESTF_000864100 [Pleodorina starrii]